MVSAHLPSRLLLELNVFFFFFFWFVILPRAFKEFERWWDPVSLRFMRLYWNFSLTPVQNQLLRIWRLFLKHSTKVNLKHWKRSVCLADCGSAPRGAVYFQLDLPGRKVSFADTTEVFLKFLCFELCPWEPFIFVTCFTSAIFSQVPKTLQLPQVKDKELRSVVNKGSSQHCFSAVRASFKFSLESTLIA